MNNNVCFSAVYLGGSKSERPYSVTAMGRDYPDAWYNLKRILLREYCAPVGKYYVHNSKTLKSLGTLWT